MTRDLCRSRLLVLVLAGALVAAACGDDDDGGEASSAEESAGGETAECPDGDSVLMAMPYEAKIRAQACEQHEDRPSRFLDGDQVVAVERHNTLFERMIHARPPRRKQGFENVLHVRIPLAPPP